MDSLTVNAAAKKVAGLKTGQANRSPAAKQRETQAPGRGGAKRSTMKRTTGLRCRRKAKAKFHAAARRRELQAFWGLLIRTSWKHQCQWPDCQETDRAKMQAAHIFGKQAFPAIRFHRWNGICLCQRHHFMADNSHRIQFSRLAEQLHGVERIDALISWAAAPRGTWGPTEHERDLTLLNEWASELGIKTI